VPTITNVHEGSSVLDTTVDAVRGHVRDTRRIAAEAQIRYETGRQDLMVGWRNLTVKIPNLKAPMVVPGVIILKF
jgi:hypothetical protein